MAISKQGGVFGFLRKSVGSVTYSTTKDSSGKRQQVVRAKVTDINNPNTLAQILQRMKLKPAYRFYKAINAADNSELLDHSWEGVQYGTVSKREFMSRAMSANGPFIPKNATRFIPAEYEVAAGSLTAVAIAVSGSTFTFAQGLVPAAAEGLTDSERVRRALYGLVGERETQVTFIYVTQSIDGSFTPVVARLIPTATQWQGVGSVPLTISGQDLVINGAVAVAIILSRKDASGTWLRSNATMQIAATLRENLYGTEAMNLAVASYQDNNTLNDLNSAWYLNLANGQAFPGQLRVGYYEVQGAGDPPSVIEVRPVLGVMTNASSLSYAVFTTDGTPEGALVYFDDTDNGIVVPESAEGNRTGAEALAKGVANTVLLWSDSYAAQLGF